MAAVMQARKNAGNKKPALLAKMRVNCKILGAPTRNRTKT